MYKTGIKKSILILIESIIGKIIDKNQILSEEILNTMCFITSETGREIALYINRKGEIIDVIIGDIDSVALKEYREKRHNDKLCGVRCIHTHPNGNGMLSELDLSALKNLKLDLIVSIGVYGGKVKDSFLAYICKDDPLYEVSIKGPYKVKDLLEIDVINLIKDIEKKYNEHIITLSNTKEEQQKAILVGINDIEDLDELSELLDTAGGIEIGRLVQSKTKIDSAYFIGKGKLRELARETQLKKPDLIVFDEELSGAQIRNLEQELGVQIIDRTQVILDIFARRASSKEGKLQVELAQLKYMMPRLIGYGVMLSRTGGGIGTRGPGEKKLEVDRRRIREKIYELEKEIKEIKKHRNVQRKSRTGNIFHVSIVGYTNAGKSSLLNALSDSNIYVENQLFATLDPTTKKVKLKGGKEIIITDTVGFIKKLPHDLINAFKSTLEEVLYADLLIHVVDGSNDNYVMQIDIVNGVLKDLGASNKPMIVAINKIDKIDIEKKLFSPALSIGKETVYISAKEKINLDKLLDTIEYYANKNSRMFELFIPYNEAYLISYIHENGSVLEKEYKDKGIYLKGELNSIVAGRVKDFIL